MEEEYDFERMCNDWPLNQFDRNQLQQQALGGGLGNYQQLGAMLGMQNMSERDRRDAFAQQMGHYPRQRPSSPVLEELERQQLKLLEVATTPRTVPMPEGMKLTPEPPAKLTPASLRTMSIDDIRSDE